MLQPKMDQKKSTLLSINHEPAGILDQIDPVFGWVAISTFPEILEKLGLPTDRFFTAGEVEEHIEEAYEAAVKKARAWQKNHPKRFKEAK